MIQYYVYALSVILLLVTSHHYSEGNKGEGRTCDEDDDTDDGCNVVACILVCQSEQPCYQEIRLLGVGRSHLKVMCRVNILRQQIDYVEVVDVTYKVRNERGALNNQEVRHYDMDEYLEVICTVKSGRLDLALGDIHENAGGDEHLVRNTYPDIDHYDHELRPLGVRQERNVILGRYKMHIIEQLSETYIGAHRIEDTRISEEVSYEDQRYKLRNSDRDDEERSPHLTELDAVGVDELGQKDTADKAGECCKQRPQERPSGDLPEGIIEIGISAVEELCEVVPDLTYYLSARVLDSPGPGEQMCRRCVVKSSIVRKCDRDKDQDRQDVDQDNTDSRKCEQCDVEITLDQRVYILPEIIDRSSLLGSLLQIVDRFDVVYPEKDEHKYSEKSDYRVKKNEEGIVIVIDSGIKPDLLISEFDGSKRIELSKARTGIEDDRQNV